MDKNALIVELVVSRTNPSTLTPFVPIAQVNGLSRLLNIQLIIILISIFINSIKS